MARPFASFALILAAEAVETSAATNFPPETLTSLSSAFECLEALYLDLVDVFGDILDPEFENNLRIFKDKCMKAMQTHKHQKVHVLVHHVPKYMRRTGVPLKSTSGQALESQNKLIDISYHRFEASCMKSRRSGP